MCRSAPQGYFLQVAARCAIKAALRRITADRPVELGSHKQPASREVFCGSADFLREGRLLFQYGDRPEKLMGSHTQSRRPSRQIYGPVKHAPRHAIHARLKWACLRLRCVGPKRGGRPRWRAACGQERASGSIRHRALQAAPGEWRATRTSPPRQTRLLQIRNISKIHLPKSVLQGCPRGIGLPLFGQLLINERSS